MARQVKGDASGNSNSAATGMPKNKAPTNRVRFGDISPVFGGSGQHDGGYGQNRWGGPSSTTPGQLVESPLATDLRTTAAQGADGGDVLATIGQFGTAAMRSPEVGDNVENVRGTPATQIRQIGAKNVPDAFGMESARSRQPSSRK